MADKEKEVQEQEAQNEEKIEEQNSSKESEEQIKESPIETPENDIESELKEQKDKFLRLFAEFDNYKKRVAKEKLEYMSMAGKDVLLEMISINDDFERAIKSFETTEDLSAVKEGVQLIYDKLNKTIEKKGVKKIEAIGQPFDTEKHEAVTEISVEEQEKKGTVIDEIESGYTMYDRVIRFAKVVVGK